VEDLGRFGIGRRPTSAFVLKGSARRARVEDAVGGHVVELPDRHAATWLTGGAGRCPRVWWGGHPVMEHGCTVSASTVGAAGHHWYRARTTHLRSGAIYVAPRAGDRTRVDTVAVIR
jgi:hypothetical protein